MESLGINQEPVHTCLETSFEEPGNENSNNKLLQRDSNDEIELGIYLHPGITINDITYKGYLEGEDIHNAVCTALRPVPEVCHNPFADMVSKSGEAARAIHFAEEGERNKERRRKMMEATRVRKAIVWSIFGFIVFAQIAFFVWYKKRRQRELSNRMRTSIDDAIVEYMRVGVSEETQDQASASAT